MRCGRLSMFDGLVPSLRVTASPLVADQLFGTDSDAQRRMALCFAPVQTCYPSPSVFFFDHGLLAWATWSDRTLRSGQSK